LSSSFQVCSGRCSGSVSGSCTVKLILALLPALNRLGWQFEVQYDLPQWAHTSFRQSSCAKARGKARNRRVSFFPAGRSAPIGCSYTNSTVQLDRRAKDSEFHV
jgi:hypothetical protein